MKTFPALSIHQPWADLIVGGKKDIENRSRWTRFRGTVLVHASRQVQQHSVELLREALSLESGEAYAGESGALIGTVEVADAVLEHPSRWFAPGYVGLVLRNPRRFERPIPYRGGRGIFQVPLAALRGTGLRSVEPGGLVGVALRGERSSGEIQAAELEAAIRAAKAGRLTRKRPRSPGYRSADSGSSS